MYVWTNEKIAHILAQLDRMNLPFGKYRFVGLDSGLHMLGKGGFANVYQAEKRYEKKNRYAIKVIGFGRRDVDERSFIAAVDAQMHVQWKCTNIVRILDYTVLRVWLQDEDTVVRTEKVRNFLKEPPSGDYLDLEFLVMEELDAVLQRDGKRTYRLMPEPLKRYDEAELIHFARDIGTAISVLHKQRQLHRDIKLENIFYTYTEHGICYKLGDFGIATETEDGMAGTYAGTQGYLAPEIRNKLEEMYDCTGDIYSFGMTLFLLMNELQFPGSDNYHANVNQQYAEGFMLPRPKHGSDALYQVVAKMCSFYPDDRYQSIKEVLHALDQLTYDETVSYAEKNLNLELALSSMFLLTGTAVWQLAFQPEIKMETGWMWYLFLGVCIGKMLLYIYEEKTTALTCLLWVLEIVLIFTSNLTWWKLLILFGLTTFSNVLVGLFGASVLLFHGINGVLAKVPELAYGFEDYKWAAVLCFSLAFVFFLHNNLLMEKTDFFMHHMIIKNRWWLIMAAAYLALLLTSFDPEGLKEGVQYPAWLLSLNSMVETSFSMRLHSMYLSWNSGYAAFGGMIFCIFWYIRETVMPDAESGSR